MSNPDGATKPTPIVSAACEAVVFTADMSTRRIAEFRTVSEILGTPNIEPEELGVGLLMWRKLAAVLDEPPMLNFAAMHLQLRLRGAIGVHPVYGDVVLTGRTIDGCPKPLSKSEIRDIRNAMAD